MFDVATRRWSELATPLKPAARFSFLSGVDQQGGRDRFLIALGEGEGRAFFNDVWALDLATHEWSEVSIRGATPRAPAVVHGLCVRRRLTSAPPLQRSPALVCR